MFLSSRNDLKKWIKQVIAGNNRKTGAIQFIFCKDNYLLPLNQQYLGHDTYTDIITFDYCEEILVSGDLFISVERVEENAKSNKVSFQEELHRVMVHGVLHLLGHSDKNPTDKKRMRDAENQALIQLNALLVQAQGKTPARKGKKS